MRRIRCPVLCMRTDQPNQRPPNHNRLQGNSTGGRVPASFAWWETHLSCSQGPRDRANTAAVFRHQFLCGERYCSAIPPKCEDKTRAQRAHCFTDPSPTIMKVAARHEGESKIDEQFYCSWGVAVGPAPALSPRCSRGRCAGRRAMRPVTESEQLRQRGRRRTKVIRMRRSPGGAPSAPRSASHRGGGTPAFVTWPRRPAFRRNGSSSKRRCRVRRRAAAHRRVSRSEMPGGPGSILASIANNREPTGQVGEHQPRPPRHL